jgi:hypothetical protein
LGSAAIRWFGTCTTASLPRENVRLPRYLASASPRPGAVFVFRCTQKLLDRLNVTLDPEPAQPDTVLGDWYAHMVRVGRIQVVLCVSDRSLLPVVVPAREGRSVVQRLGEALESTLTAIGVPIEDVIAERGAMKRWAVGRTTNRRVLGSLNELAFQLQVGLHDSPDRTLLAQSLWLAKTPLKVIDHGAPDQATLAAFAARRAVQAASVR